MRTTLKFAVSRREEGKALGSEVPNELSQSQCFKYQTGRQDNSVQIFRVGDGEIGHDELSQQQSRKHRAMNDPAGTLFIPAERFQFKLFKSPV